MHIDKTEDFYFVQIGAFDGVRNDIIREFILKYKWRGILVEPVKYLFDKLVNNYKEQDNLIFENVAISEKNGIRDFHRLKENIGNLLPYYEELGTLSPEIILKNRDVIPNIEDYLITEKVNCVTLSDLLKKHNINKVDLLQVDTEGYDYNIIKTIDFRFINPRIILYEHKHLTPVVNKECINFLKNKGYLVAKLGVDTLVFKFPAKKNLKSCLMIALFAFNLILGNFK